MTKTPVTTKNSITPSSMPPKLSYKTNGIIIARGSIDSAFENQSREDFDSSVRMAASGQAEMMTNGQHSMTIMKPPYQDGSFTQQSITMTGLVNPLTKSPNDKYDHEVSRIVLLGNQEEVSISNANLRDLETPAHGFGENHDETGASLRVQKDYSAEKNSLI